MPPSNHVTTKFKVGVALAFVVLASWPTRARAGPLTGLTMGPATPFPGLRCGLTLHGGLGGEPVGFDAVVGGGLGVLVVRPEERGEVTRWRPRLAFGVEGGYRFRGHGETRAYVTGLGAGPFTFGGGFRVLAARPRESTLLGVGLGPEVDAHVPIGDRGPVLQLFLRGEVTLVNREEFGDSATLGARVFVDLP